MSFVLLTHHRSERRKSETFKKQKEKKENRMQKEGNFNLEMNLFKLINIHLI